MGLNSNFLLCKWGSKCQNLRVIVSWEVVTSIQRWTKVNVQGLPLFLHKHAMIYNLRATSIKRENNARATMPSQRLFWLARRLTIKILQKQKYQVHHTYKISPASFQCCQLKASWVLNVRKGSCILLIGFEIR